VGAEDEMRGWGKKWWGQWIKLESEGRGSAERLETEDQLTGWRKRIH
jgi:hypothetical protein